MEWNTPVAVELLVSVVVDETQATAELYPASLLGEHRSTRAVCFKKIEFQINCNSDRVILLKATMKNI